MVVDNGYICEKCGKVYHKTEQTLPVYCKGCGEDLVKKRYWYNLTTNYYGDLVETRESNVFGGYDYVKTILTDNVRQIKLKRKHLLFWEPFNTKD